jgi:hypothetical protein
MHRAEREIESSSLSSTNRAVLKEQLYNRLHRCTLLRNRHLLLGSSMLTGSFPKPSLYIGPASNNRSNQSFDSKNALQFFLVKDLKGA